MEMGRIKILLALLLLALTQLANGDNVVQTNNGPIRGKTVASGKVEAFLGIPYAEPPVGPMRFAKPVPKTSWNGIYEATKLPPPCIQMNLGKAFYAPDVADMSEDCLYLNVWTPHPKGGDELKAVMFFIHGGGFATGSSSMELYNGTKLAEYGDVVVVGINYRVGALGFLAGFTEDAPGSQGLYDQVMALQWIKDNAKHFHGDPDRITIFGESAGAFSVSMHQISPLSKNLFRRAILQSGSAINPVYTNKNEVVSAVSQLYANLLGCTNGNNTLDKDKKVVTDCLRNVSATKIGQTEFEFFQKRISGAALAPRIGNDFLPENTIDSFRKGHFKDSEVLMGITRDEGSMLLIGQMPELIEINDNKNVEDLFNETTAYNFIKSMLGNIYPGEDDKIIRSYLDKLNKETGYTYLKAVVEAVGDSVITCGQIFQAEYQSMRNNPIYFYMFDHRTSSAPYAEWMGVPHFDEVQYVFGIPMFKQFSAEEKKLSRDIMNMWTTFAKTGIPKIPGSATWPKYTYQNPKYCVIGKGDIVDSRPDNYRCEIWRNRFRSQIDESVINALKKN